MSDAAAERLRIALDLADTGVALKRQNLRRAHPDASDERIERLVIDWINDRPADCPGPSRSVPGA